MAKVIALIVWLGIIQTMKIQLVRLVQWDFIQTRIFKLPIILVNNAHRVRIPRLQVYPVLTDATNVQVVNIRWKMAILIRRNVNPVRQELFKIYRATPCVVTAPVDLETT